MTARDELLFLPLGGAGEIGMNLNLYGLDGKWLMVDLGVCFDGEGLPGVDVVMPDPSFIEQRREDLLALVLTHGHEDHLGAVPYLWPRLECPVYATPFTAALLRRKLEETSFADRIEIHEVPLQARFSIGPFDLEMITMTHSILEPNAVAIRTRLGTVLHTGDFKIDPEPLLGETTDESALRRLGDGGVLAMVCDSTNVFHPGESGSEGALRRSLDKLIAGRDGRVAVATFASNFARLDTLARLAANHGRQVVLVGRSLWRIAAAAREAGYGADLPPFLSDEAAAGLPPNGALWICTGCQGEARGAMTRIAFGDHPHLALETGDLAVFSSKIIPGNERAIYRVHNRLVELGVEVVGEQDDFVHVSGHPARDELARMYQWVRPRVAVPVHGERRHIAEHAALARALQVPQAVAIANGHMLRLAPGPAETVDYVTSGRLALDGEELVAVDSEILRDRRRLMFNGIVTAFLVIDSAGGLIAEPRITSRGVLESETDPDAVKRLAAKVEAAVESAPRRARGNDEVVREAARLALRREIKRRYRKRPQILVELVRL